jgi:adenine-specific DNA-methyltransferase
MYGMVLPDIVLLKDYPGTRLFMLENLCLNDICWWGMAFNNAVIDAVTIIAKKDRASNGQLVHVKIEDTTHPLEHTIPQRDFLGNPRYTFNLHLTAERRAILETLETLPKLGDLFEVHEGVHSGNMRAELFVDSASDSTCRPLYFGRDEIVPYCLRWKGSYVRLGVVPDHRNGKKYANIGRQEWHERPKVLVRRTGDHVMAAVDEDGLYASNNFFLVFPCRDSALDLYGLCALLNSSFMTWYFRCIEPRKGRVFAELKIKHLSVFPLPSTVYQANACNELNGLGRERAVETGRLGSNLPPAQVEARMRHIRTIDNLINQCVLALMGLNANVRDQIA